tara:strand:+ start:220 stop:432 length:213 start_codon:yes stop_codon:yes gene_type:complete
VDAMGQRREDDGILLRIDIERVGDLVICKWMCGLCLITNYEKRKHHSIFEVYHFDTQQYYWVDEDEVEKL